MINPGERKFYSTELKKEIGEYAAQFGNINAAVKYNCSLSTVRRAVRLHYKNNPTAPVILKELPPPPVEKFNFSSMIESKVRKIVKEELTKFFGL